MRPSGRKAMLYARPHFDAREIMRPVRVSPTCRARGDGHATRRPSALSATSTKLGHQRTTTERPDAVAETTVCNAVPHATVCPLALIAPKYVRPKQAGRDRATMRPDRASNRTVAAP